MEIIKSPNDSCKYEILKLDNKLNVLLINDPDITISYVSMIVKVGYMYDKINGMAHFLEHMLFNGTEKYPDENAFMKFTTKHGGFTNAYTQHNCTCYYYGITSDYLNESLDMFGNFFISPLFNKDSIDREKEAVNAEHIKNIKNDSWRYFEILKHTANQNNPFTNFGTGCNQTLNIDNICDYVKEFYNKYYSSDLMTLCIITNNKISHVRKLVINTFSNIKLNVNQYNRIKNYGAIINDSKLIYVNPIESINKLIIHWDIPSFYNTVDESPSQLLTYILGHEGENSIYYILTEYEYISKLYSSIINVIQDRCILTIELDLTETGIIHREKIVQIIFNYIESIRKNIDNIQQIYDQKQKLDNFTFKYYSKSNPYERILSYNNLIGSYDFPLNEILTIMYKRKSYEYVKKNLLKTLESMNKCIIVYGSKEYENLDKYETDKYYGTKYKINNVDINNFINKSEYQNIKLIGTNPYVSIGDSMIEKTYIKPYKTIDSNNITAYYHPSNQFYVPDVSIRVSINVPESLKDVNNFMSSILFIECLNDEINYEKYLCKMANYTIDTYYSFGTINFNIEGNYEKILKIVKIIVDSFINIKISNKTFNKILKMYKLNNLNALHNPPYQKLDTFFMKYICNKYFDNYDIINNIDNMFSSDITLNIDNIKKIFKDILISGHMKILIGGNCNEETFNGIVSLFSIIMKNSNEYCNINSIHNSFIIPTNYDEIIIYPLENEYNNAMAYYIYIDKIVYGMSKNWNKNICLLKILQSVMSSEYFDELRTQENYGYICSGFEYVTGYSAQSLFYYKFLVQSPDKNVDNIIDRTSKFIKDFKIKLNKLTINEFNKIIKSCIDVLMDNISNLTDYMDFYNDQLVANYLSFDLKENLITTYKLLKKKDLIEFYDEKFINKKTIVIGLTK